MSYGIPLDKWAANETTVSATIFVQSVCCIISTFCFIVRLVQVCKYTRNNDTWLTIPSTMMTTAPLLCMGMNVLYLFTHLWNYIHWFESNNIFDCRLWFIILICLIWLARIFLYQFLLLRSLVIFTGSIYQISARFVFIFLIIHALLTIACTSVLLTDFTPIQPFHGFCFRIIGENGFIAGEIWWAADCASAIIVWVVFWLKVREISKTFEMSRRYIDTNAAVINVVANNSRNENKARYGMKIYKSFRKQMFLGMLTVFGSILIFVLKYFLTVLLGVMFALDATANNMLLFLFFKENQKYYEFFCCRNVSCSKPKKLTIKYSLNTISNSATNTDADITIGENIEMEHLSLK